MAARFPAFAPAVLLLSLAAAAATQTPAPGPSPSPSTRLLDLQRQATDLLERAARAGVTPDEVDWLLADAARHFEALAAGPAIPATLRADLHRAAVELAPPRAGRAGGDTAIRCAPLSRPARSGPRTAPGRGRARPRLPGQLQPVEAQGARLRGPRLGDGAAAHPGPRRRGLRPRRPRPRSSRRSPPSPPARTAEDRRRITSSSRAAAGWRFSTTTATGGSTSTSSPPPRSRPRASAFPTGTSSTATSASSGSRTSRRRRASTPRPGATGCAPVISTATAGWTSTSPTGERTCSSGTRATAPSPRWPPGPGWPPAAGAPAARSSTPMGTGTWTSTSRATSRPPGTTSCGRAAASPGGTVRASWWGRRDCPASPTCSSRTVGHGTLRRGDGGAWAR